MPQLSTLKARLTSCRWWQRTWRSSRKSCTSWRPCSRSPISSSLRRSKLPRSNNSALRKQQPTLAALTRRQWMTRSRRKTECSKRAREMLFLFERKRMQKSILMVLNSQILLTKLKLFIYWFREHKIKEAMSAKSFTSFLFGVGFFQAVNYAQHKRY